MEEKITVKKQLDEVMDILKNIAVTEENHQYETAIIDKNKERPFLINGFQRVQDLADVLETNTIPQIYELLGIELED